MRVSPVIWRKRLMDSISGNLGYLPSPSEHSALLDPLIRKLKFERIARPVLSI
jgi:hypothetical protein